MRQAAAMIPVRKNGRPRKGFSAGALTRNEIPARVATDLARRLNYSVIRGRLIISRVMQQSRKVPSQP